jgi:ABC-type bacteriocin/lantibiotic exporter with double-glycine peptidase domain
MKVINGQITVGSLIALYGVFTWTSQAYESIYTLMMTFFKIKPSFERIVSVFFLHREKKKQTPGDKFQYISMEDVTFSLEQKSIVDKVTLNVNSGKKIVVTGSSGSGKSMIADLMLNLREPTSGEIIVNGIPLTDIDNGWFRNNIIEIS